MERVSWDRCAARYPWETVETCEEAAPPGFWCDHIFHMANISESAWDYYRFSANVEFLEKKAYPIIIACSEFYLKHTVYRNVNGKTIVLKYVTAAPSESEVCRHDLFFWDSHYR